uniref:Odorant-binding protein 13 n=1 Tax=Chrysomela populi TaxID=154003 RepID=A0A2Y9CLG5_CHRPP|nr:odorant-binding protein 13 [Chrysomela populi]
MKFAVAVVLAVAVCFVQGDLSPEQVEKVKQHHKECMQASGITPELLAKTKKGEFPDNQKLKEHMFCFAQKADLMDAQGKIKKDVLLAKASTALGDRALAQKLIDECAVQKKDGPETAFQCVKCYYEKTPSHLSLV